MANEEHLAILKQGPEVWNKWRLENAEIAPSPDLTGADLRNIDLSGGVDSLSGRSGFFLFLVDFRGANLSNTNLRGADLQFVLFQGANLTNADLSDASLLDTRLSGANCTGANLIGTDIHGTLFDHADLTHAKLNHAVFRAGSQHLTNFTNSVLERTCFCDLDLRNAIGLNAVTHLGPSSIDVGTIYRSKGQIPDEFLIGVGLPDEMIAFVHSISGAIQFYSCFISYSSKDEEIAKRIHADLQTHGVRCWFAPEDLKIGDRFRARIDESILLYDKLLLILSGHSVSSSWVEKEVETAMEKERDQRRTVLFPVRLDDAVMDSKTGWAADIRRTRHIGDFRQWKDHDAYQKAFDHLLRDLKAGGREKPESGSNRSL